MLNRGYFLLFLILLLPILGLTQSVEKDENGQKIVIFDDGSWRYYEVNDSVYVDENTENKKEQPLDIYHKYLQMFEVSKQFEVEAQLKTDAAQNEFYQLEQRYKKEQKDNNKRVTKAIKSDLSEARSQLDDLNRKLTLIRGVIKKLQKIADEGMYEDIQKVNLPKSLKETYLINVWPDQSGTSSDIASEKSQNSLKFPLNRKKSIQSAVNSSDQYFVPAYDCQIAYEGVDNFSENVRIELMPELLFTYTDERLKPYLKDREYVTCNAFMSSYSGGFRILTLEIVLASRKARKEYGMLRSGTLLNIRLLNGETVSLLNQNADNGKIDLEKGETYYKAVFGIDYQQQKQLLKSPVDRIRLVWSTGYEDYEVYNLDFFINQFSCLEN